MQAQAVPLFIKEVFFPPHLVHTPVNYARPCHSLQLGEQLKPESSFLNQIFSLLTRICVSRERFGEAIYFVDKK